MLDLNTSNTQRNVQLDGGTAKKSLEVESPPVRSQCFAENKSPKVSEANLETMCVALIMNWFLKIIHLLSGHLMQPSLPRQTYPGRQPPTIPGLSQPDGFENPDEPLFEDPEDPIPGGIPGKGSSGSHGSGLVPPPVIGQKPDQPDKETKAPQGSSGTSSSAAQQSSSGSSSAAQQSSSGTSAAAQQSSSGSSSLSAQQSSELAAGEKQVQFMEKVMDKESTNLTTISDNII